MKTPADMSQAAPMFIIARRPAATAPPARRCRRRFRRYFRYLLEAWPSFICSPSMAAAPTGADKMQAPLMSPPEAAEISDERADSGVRALSAAAAASAGRVKQRCARCAEFTLCERDASEARCAESVARSGAMTMRGTPEREIR